MSPWLAVFGGVAYAINNVGFVYHGLNLAVCYDGIYQGMEKNRVIKQLDMELFGGCNYDCEMCPQKDGGREKTFKVMMPFDVFKKVVDEALTLGVEAISLHGSGEATMCRYLPEAIAYIKSKNPNIKVVMLSNGYALTPKLSDKIIEAGLDVLRISAIGYDRETYHRWMSKDAFEKVRGNAKYFKQRIDETNASTELHTYHLVIDRNNKEAEIEQYQKNWVDYVDSFGEMWLMHNWAGSFADTPYSRIGASQQRSCGRMFQPILQVRAGGLEKGRYAAVVACCMVLGRDSEAVLGHLDQQSIVEVLNGELYEELRTAHREKRWDDISYCKDCDQLYELPESLVWSNIPNRRYKQSKLLDDLIIEVKEI